MRMRRARFARVVLELAQNTFRYGGWGWFERTLTAPLVLPRRQVSRHWPGRRIIVGIGRRAKWVVRFRCKGEHPSFEGRETGPSVDFCWRRAVNDRVCCRLTDFQTHKTTRLKFARAMFIAEVSDARVIVFLQRNARLELRASAKTDY